MNSLTKSFSDKFASTRLLLAREISGESFGKDFFDIKEAVDVAGHRVLDIKVISTVLIQYKWGYGVSSGK